MRSTTRESINRWWFVTALVVIVVLFVSYGQFDKWRTTQKFESLERDVDVLISELEKQSITEVSKNKYCLRDGEKFGGGQLRCSIIVSSTLKDENKDTDTFLVKSEKAFTDGNFVKDGEMDKQERIIYIPYTHNNFYCRLTLTKENTEYTQLEFYCIDAVNKPIYPVME